MGYELIPKVILVCKIQIKGALGNPRLLYDFRYRGLVYTYICKYVKGCVKKCILFLLLIDFYLSHSYPFYNTPNQLIFICLFLNIINTFILFSTIILSFSLQNKQSQIRSVSRSTRGCQNISCKILV